MCAVKGNRKAQIGLAAAFVLVVGVATASGLTSKGARSKATQVTVLLDWTLNPAHSGLLTAIDAHTDTDAGVAVKLQTPPASSDGTRLLLSGRADLAVMDIHDLAIARERGRDLIAVMTVIGKPLASLIASPAIKRPRDLEGKTVAISGAPSDIAVTRSIVAADGGDPNKVHIQQAGYAATEALVGGRADAATGFFNEEGVALAAKNRGFHTFRLDSYGAPAYPELLLVTTKKKIAEARETIKATVGALAEGTRLAVSDPTVTLDLLKTKLPGADQKLLKARTDASLGAMLPPNRRAGSLDPELMREWGIWEAAQHIVKQEPDTVRMMTIRFTLH